MTNPASSLIEVPNPARGLTILIVDDEEPLRHMLRLLLEKQSYTVQSAASAAAALEVLRAGEIDLVLCDVRMPEHDGRWLLQEIANAHLPVATVMMSAYVDQEIAVECLRLGARDYLSKPFKPDEVLHKLKLAAAWLALESERTVLKQENQRLIGELGRERGLGDMVGASAQMREVFQLVTKIAAYKTTVLVLGESGTGKELVAKLLHHLSLRTAKPFVPINCGAIPEQLLESELFGHVRGAFTDASRNKTGLFEEADGGTLFLDEIGDLPSTLQVKLLRFLQDEEIRRVGDNKGIKVDVRVVAATAKDLTAMVQAGTFREDLYYRLNVLQVRIPPLRERRDDIPPLVEHFITTYQKRLNRAIKGITPECRTALLTYAWPGNVRELENAVEQAMVLSDGDWLDVESLPSRVVAVSAPTTNKVEEMLAPGELSIKKAVRTIEELLIRRALSKTNGNRTRAAHILEISHRALLYKLKEYGIK